MESIARRFARGAALAALLAALLFPGCGRGPATRRAAARAAAGDTLANGLPRPLVAGLAGWFDCWRAAGAPLSPDSLAATPERPHAFRLAEIVRAGGRRDDVRTRAGIELLAPDSLHAVDFDLYLEATREADGRTLPGREPDSAPLLADFRGDSLWIVDFCGTPCSFEAAAWVDATRFAVVGTTSVGPDAGVPRAAFLDLHDLARHTVRRWLSRPVSDAAADAYLAAGDSALTARLTAAGRGLAPGTVVLSRALEPAPPEGRAAVR